MYKTEFFLKLTNRLSFLPWEEAEERVNFYLEMIDDQMEEGLSEEEAVAAVGSIDEIVAQIISEIPLSKIAKKKMQPKRRLKAWEIVLLALGSPIWFSLGIAAAAVVFSLYVSAWSVVISLWSVFVSLVACAAAGVVASVVLVIGGHSAAGIAMLAAGVICAGLSIFACCGCKVVTKGILVLTKKFVLWVKRCLIKKEEAE